MGTFLLPGSFSALSTPAECVFINVSDWLMPRDSVSQSCDLLTAGPAVFFRTFEMCFFLPQFQRPALVFRITGERVNLCVLY